MDVVLECGGLRKAFGDRVAVDGVGFTIAAGELRWGAPCSSPSRSERRVPDRGGSAIGSTDEHVREGIRVPLDKVRGNGFERYEASVGREHGMEAVRIPLDTCGVHAHADRRAQFPVAKRPSDEITGE
jgi:hypothetical protein